MGDPNSGEIYEGVLRNESDVPLDRKQAEWLKSLTVKDRIKRLQEMAQGMCESDAPVREMPRYKCHKEVWALQIKDLQPPEGVRPTIAQLEEFLGRHGSEEAQLTPDGAVLTISGAMVTPSDDRYAPFKVSPEYICKHKPQIGGYYVRYKDGYESYSPAQAFEEGYTKL